MLLRLTFLLSILLIPLTLAQDYYAILGLNKDASDKEIKSSYRQLSKKFHPDKNPGDEEAHHKFIEIGEAYEVLSDPEKRKIFDQYGADALKNGGPGGPGGGGGGFNDPFDIFEQMFNRGGGGGGGGFGRMQRPRGHNLKVREQLSLKEYYTGATLEFTLALNDICDHCDGTGSADGKVAKCSDCQGRGVVIQVIRMGMMTQQIQQMCGRCGGKGSVIKNHCKTCHGSKVVKKQKPFHVEVPPGAARHYTETRSGESDKGADFDAGDVFIEFNEKTTNNLGYRRRGPHLYRTEVLSAREALKGDWQREVEFLDEKKKVKIARAKNVVVHNGEVERIPGFGMPQPNGKHAFGDLFIEYVVVMPHEISKSGIRDEL
ncbi:Scj1p TDEL_0B03790 [Torulaspora delbrueckii]|uniref:J domain-containing protein n=1 Tax=Torulaspora delbrueckii TaxID=4950 RepID=G8ZPG4_TORDE|nr:hypothetical protein TDEL_0B03790 [Torulaspora delbrueckii]CCE90508.1 hypothetical protein TDEL_0B03790 [Torulaspora delbrueckii]